MFSFKNRQYWTWVILSSALGVFIVLQRVNAIKDEVRIPQNNNPVIEQSLDQEEQAIYIDSKSIMEMDANSLNNSPARIKVYLRTLIQKINKQETFINDIISGVESNKTVSSTVLSKQKEIDRYAKVIESIYNRNGFKNYVATQKAYLAHHIQYTKDDDLSVFNYTNGVRRYYLTLLGRSL